MFRKTFVAIALAASLAGGTAAAGSADATAAAAEVAAAAESLRAAMLDPNSATLSALVADELDYGHSGGKVDSKGVFIKDLLDRRPDFLTLAITEQEIKVVDDGIAIVRHKMVAEYEDSGKRGKVSLRVLGVWTKQGGAWRLLARQAVPA